MTKKKLMAFIALGLVLAYLAGALIIFSATNSIEGIRFRNISDRAISYDPVTQYEGSELPAEEYINMLIYQSNSNFTYYPYAAAVYDSKGNIVAQTGSILRYIFRSDAGNYTYYYVNMDSYLTDEIKKSITEMKNERSYIDIVELEYNLENGELIPIKIVLEDYNAKEESRLTLTFSEEKAQYSVENYQYDSRHYLQLTLIDIDVTHYNHKIYREIYEELRSDETKEEACRRAESAALSGGGSLSSEYLYYWKEFKIDGEYYCFYQVSKRRAVIGTLVSDNFKSFLYMEMILFVILGIIIMIAANKIYNKNKRLEKARLAFTGAAAHELKTPLAVISNQCECILEDIAPEKNKEYVSSIYDEALRMNKLVASLLQYNRISSLDKISREKADLGEIACAEAEKYESLFKGKNISVEKEISKAEISCNAELIALVIDNFLSNAVKHTSLGGKIKIAVRNDKKNTVLTVFNSGSIIYEPDAAHIWEELYREDKARTSGSGSSGMGLAICKKILELHGFKYGFKNKDGGVEFYFSSSGSGEHKKSK